ncbi:hypothetical protein, partial [Azospirillum argentinense]|uniref:hypothetical protein n=1 Tax=Azospirillum argentinense TaxID=2970906 RepID=UPI00190ECA0C
MTDDHSPVDHSLVIEHANRFEAIAAEGFEGRPYRDALAHSAQHVTAHPDLAPRVAHALRMMIGFIEDSDCLLYTPHASEDEATGQSRGPRAIYTP